MKSLLACLSVAAVTACQSVPEPVEPKSPAVPTMTAQSLSDLLHDYVSTTGNQVTYDEETGRWLDSIPVESVGPADMRLLRLGPVPVGTVRASLSEDDAGQASGLHVEILKLQHADAATTASALDDLARDAIGAGTGQIRVVADERTNSLLIWANAENIERVKALAERLDVDKS